MAAKIRNGVSMLLASLLVAAHPVGAVEKISLHALFTNKAIIVIDGTRRVLSVGDTSPEGIKLVATDTQEETAQIEIDGRRQELALGVVASNTASSGPNSVVLYPNGAHFYADGLINGVSVRFLVDTGATMVAMDDRMARRIGIDYRNNGKVGVAGTAGGLMRAYYVKLDTVEVGEIKLYNIDGAVIEASGMNDVLLGMSFLGRLDMKRDGEKLELIQRY